MFLYTTLMLVHPAHLVLSYATLSNEIFCCSFLIESLFCLCAYHNNKMYFIPQPQEQKSSRRHTQCSSTLCGWLCTQPLWCCLLQPFHMRYFVSHFWPKSYCFPPSPTAEWISKLVCSIETPTNHLQTAFVRIN